MNDMARRLFGKEEYRSRFQPLSPSGQQVMLAAFSQYSPLAYAGQSGVNYRFGVGNPEHTGASRAGERTAQLAGESDRWHDARAAHSRGGEAWLAPATFGDNIYELPGLDPEAASTWPTSSSSATRRPSTGRTKIFRELLTLLDGYPLPMEIVLANLARQSPGEVLAALEEGLKEIDTTKKSKTESLLACIDYSYGNLSTGIARQLLLCLAPFAGVLFVEGMAQYIDQLKQQSALAGSLSSSGSRCWMRRRTGGCLLHTMRLRAFCGSSRSSLTFCATGSTPSLSCAAHGGNCLPPTLRHVERNTSSWRTRKTPKKARSLYSRSASSMRICSPHLIWHYRLQVSILNPYVHTSRLCWTRHTSKRLG